MKRLLSIILIFLSGCASELWVNEKTGEEAGVSVVDSCRLESEKKDYVIPAMVECMSVRGFKRIM